MRLLVTPKPFSTPFFIEMQMCSNISFYHPCLFPFFADHHLEDSTASGGDGGIAERKIEGTTRGNRAKRKTDRLTAYACEDTTLNITCGHDLYLDVIRANYGRFSITICNQHGKLL